MAFDRATISYELAASVMKRDNNEVHERVLIDYLLTLLDLSTAELKAISIADLAQDLEDRLAYVAPG